MSSSSRTQAPRSAERYTASKPYTPQMSDGDMAMLIGSNQPWKDRDEIESDVRSEQLRQRLWNGG